MTARSDRIARIVKLRDNELKQTIARLVEASAREQRLQQAYQAAGRARDKALDERRNLALGAVDIMTYLQAEDWLLSQQAKHAIAAQQLQQASVMLQKCTLLTARARTRVKQLEHLQTSLLQKAARKLELAERKLDDETSQRAFRRKR